MGQALAAAENLSNQGPTLMTQNPNTNMRYNVENIGQSLREP